MATTAWKHQQGNITEGPGKYDLMLAIMEGKHVEFTLEGYFGKTGKITVAISTLDREDGSSQSWNIIGHGGDDIAMKGFYLRGTVNLLWNVNFYYHSGRRKGTYKITLQ